MKVEVSNGELLDKFSILKIKEEEIKELDKIRNIKNEILEIFPLCEVLLEKDDISCLYSQLKIVNKALWDIEDEIRKKENRKEFDQEFIELARNVYFKNDERSVIKKTINLATGSNIIEEKSYKDYK